MLRRFNCIGEVEAIGEGFGVAKVREKASSSHQKKTGVVSSLHTIAFSTKKNENEADYEEERKGVILGFAALARKE